MTAASNLVRRLQATILLRDPAEEEELKALLHIHYQPIRDVFRWYSNIMGQTHSDSPDAFRMNHGEWNALVSDCRIVSAKNFSAVNPSKVCALPSMPASPLDG